MIPRYLPILSLPCGVCSLWAVGAGFYALALLATLLGGLALYVGEEDG